MIDPQRFRPAATLAFALRIALGAVLVFALYAMYLPTRANLERLGSWTRYPVEIVSLAGDMAHGEMIEIEIAADAARAIPGRLAPDIAEPYTPGNTRLLLPRAAWSVYRTGAAATLVQDPLHPSTVALLNPLGMWLPVAAAAVLALLALGALGRLQRARWGEDLSWTEHGWEPTGGLSTAPGERARDAPIVESRRTVRGRIVRCSLLWCAAATGLLAWPGVQSPAALAVALVAILLAAWRTHALVELHTRRLCHDDAGLLEQSFFGARRIAWERIGSVQRVNVNAAAQKRHDSSLQRKRGTADRPRDVYRFELRDTQQRLVFSWNPDLQSPLAFENLVARANRGKLDTSPAARRAASAQRHLDSERRYAAAQSAAGPLHRGAAPPVRRITLVLMALALLPFVLGTAWMASRSLWFELFAERTDGTVIATSGGEAPALTVEYFDANGQAYRIESDGSPAYRRLGRGDRVAVRFDPDEPADARLPGFLENWLLVLIMAGISGLIAGCFWLVLRELRNPFPGAPSIG